MMRRSTRSLRYATLAVVTLALLLACDAMDNETSPPPVATAGEADPSPPQLTVSHSGEYGRFLASDDGRALYTLDQDTENQSQCHNECIATWPPFLAASETPVAADAIIEPDLIGTFTRPEGRDQITYAGQPLYFYLPDINAEAASGHGISDQWGTWHLVQPNGQPVSSPGS